MPKVSVVMSVYNNRNYLRNAILSILKQTFKDFEFIIIDDTSIASSKQIIAEFAKNDRRIKVITNKKRLGLTRSLNLGIKKAKGEFIARMDADDIALPERLRKQVDYLDKHSQVVVLGSWAILIDENGEKLRIKRTPINTKDIKDNILKANPFIHPTLIFRKEIFKKVGFYNEKYPYAQDYELVLRILKNYKGANISKTLLLYRVGDMGSVSVKNLKQQEWLSLKARFDALFKFGYSLSNIIYLIKPLFSFLIPSKIKIFLYRNFYWNL